VLKSTPVELHGLRNAFANNRGIIIPGFSYFNSHLVHISFCALFHDITAPHGLYYRPVLAAHSGIRSNRTVARNFICGSIWRQTNEWPKTTRGVGIFFDVCFEIVHFSAKVTNAVRHHWFSGDYNGKTDLRLINLLC